MSDMPKGLAKVSWTDPEDNQRRDYVLTEGSTVTIGRSRNNEICIPQQHVSRQHAVISHQYGIFMISDLGSANGTFVNDQQLVDPFPLAHGDIIRLYVPTLEFSAAVTPEEEREALITGSFTVAARLDAQPRLMITSGPQEGAVYPILGDSVKMGRSVASAEWEIRLEDRAVSRPHAEIARIDGSWYITDLGSSNGTMVSNQLITERTELKDGFVITIGQTTILFRLGGV